ncbi:MAG: dihydrofolate reductase [Legionellales bacterium]|nr:dihydrofolate reductase [Legionellales bacterium]
MKNISIVVAMAKNRVIGNQGRLPWHIPEDLKWFKKVTMGHPIIMGRKTFLSIGRPLPGRKNIILTTQKDFLARGCIVLNDFSAITNILPDSEEMMVIGGAQVYKKALLIANKIYLTMIENDFAGDVYFPDFNLADWQIIEEHNLENLDKYKFKCRHIIYSKKNKAETL